MRLTVNFHHDGNFVPSPLMYQEGEKSTIRDLEFEGMTVIRLSKLLQRNNNDLDLANCIAVGYKNGKVVDMFLEHHGYDLREDDVVIPNRSINDPFFNKLCNGNYINDFNDKSDGGEYSQPSAKELEIDSDDEDVDKNFKLVDGQFALKIIEDPTITYRSIQEQIKMKYLINVSVGQCKRAKQRALFDHEGGLIEHYSRLWDYRKQLLDTNPGSSVHLHVDELDNGKIHFKRIYVCFKAMIEGWSAGCRKVIGLDGCFLKGTCWSVETIDNWEWFLACLCEDLRLDSGASLTVISDGHKGLMESVKNLFATMQSIGMLQAIIYANFKKKWNGLHFKSLFWLAATTTIQHTFYSKMNLIGNIDPEAKQSLVDRNPNNWCRAFFKIDRGCATYENGISESYHNAIRIARENPIEESYVDNIPTQQSKISHKTAKIIEDAIATGKLKTAGLKRRCKSERIAKRAKPFQFGKDGAGSCADKAWDVDEVLAEE
ncbi:hypothetical protein Tco_0090722 [Tanacetum coccineum]